MNNPYWIVCLTDSSTSSVIGHSEEGLSLDAEGLPVLGSVGLQALVSEELLLPLTPLIDDGVLLPSPLTASRVSHHHRSAVEQNGKGSG